MLAENIVGKKVEIKTFYGLRRIEVKSVKFDNDGFVEFLSGNDISLNEPVIIKKNEILSVKILNENNI